MARTDWEYADRYAFYMAYDQVCGCCRLPLKFNDFEVDHIIPVCVAEDAQKWPIVLRDYGLPEVFDVQGDGNRIAACRRCNSDKRDALLGPERIAILHGVAERKAPKVRKFREDGISLRTTHRALAQVSKALSDANLCRQDLL